MTNLLGKVRTCRGCGCDDNHACVTAAGPCAWALIDVDAQTGVCTVCAERIAWHPALLATIGFEEGDSALQALGFEDDFARREDAA